jgi:hypothetical protein
MHRFTLTPLPSVALAFIAAQSLAAQTIARHWEGVMVQQGSPLPISLDFTTTTTGLTATWSAPGMRALRIPLQKVSATGRRVHFELVGDQSSTVFDGELKGDSLVGTFSGGRGEGTFLMTRQI